MRMTESISWLNKKHMHIIGQTVEIIYRSPVVNPLFVIMTFGIA